MDIRTLLACTLLVQICCGAGLYLVARTVPGFHSLRWWAFAYLLISAGFFAAMHGPLLPARLLALAGGILLAQGVAEHLSPHSRVLRRGAVLFAAFALLGGSVAHLSRGPDIVQIAFSLCFGSVLLAAAWLALARHDAERLPRRVLGGLLGGIAVLILARGIVAPIRGVSNAPFRPDDLRFAGLALYLMFASGLAFVFVWLVAARMRRQFETEARTDALTGVLNRRALDAVLARELARTRPDRGLAVLAIDMDRFKQVNDQYGHPAGDQLLAAAAQAMASGLRDSDFLARFGGEEFVAVLPARDAARAALVAERLRARVAALAVAWEGRHLTVTASIGVAVWEPGDTSDALLGRADRRLYAAKHAGRNRVCASAEEPALAAALR